MAKAQKIESCEIALGVGGTPKASLLNNNILREAVVLRTEVQLRRRICFANAYRFFNYFTAFSFYSYYPVSRGVYRLVQ